MPRCIHHLTFVLTILMVAAGSAWAEAPHDASNGIVCDDCHAMSTTGFAPHGEDQEAMCRTCHNPTGMAAAMSDVSRHVVGDGHVVLDCTSCHDPHGPQETTDPHAGGKTALNLKLIRKDTGKDVPAAEEPAVFHDRPGHFAFSESDPPWTGICQTCHTQTRYHTNGPAADHDHEIGHTCTGCHRHENGFLPSGRTCTGCHSDPRGKRRQIVGPGGDFDQASRHIAGTIDNEDCLVCHEMSGHRQGGVLLRNPDTGGIWAGDRDDWCLTCHDGDPPLGVAFPAEIGRQYDKSGFPGSPHDQHMQSASCSHCHDAHGSRHASLLKDAYGPVDPNDGTGGGDAYALCWRCHSETSILAGDNAFGEYHFMHVVEKGVPCFGCHDVHEPAEVGEPGLIRFDYAIERGRDISHLDDHDAGSSFTLSNDAGACYIRCHAKDHNPMAYSRAAHSVTHCAPCHLPNGKFAHDPEPLYCSDCHRGDRPSSPHPQEDDCITCHRNPGGTWKDVAYNHDPTPPACAFCHADTRPASPHPQDGDCGSCHNDPGGSWSNATYNHSPTPSSCASCHEGSRPAAPHPQSTDCVNCHNDPGGSWSNATYDHSPTPSGCASCHEGSRPAAPHPQGTDCVNCHSDPGGSWSNATYSHSPTPSSCASCHEGSRPAAPHPQSTDCVNCHSDPGGSWDGASYSHNPPPTECAVCHESRRPKSSEHNQTLDCAGCHRNPGGSWDDDDDD